MPPKPKARPLNPDFGLDELLKADKQRRKALGAGKAKAAAAKAATPKRGVKAQKDLGILAKSTPKKGAIAAKTGVTPKRKPTGAGMAVKQMPKKKHVSANGNGMATPKANIPQKQQTNKTPKKVLAGAMKGIKKTKLPAFTPQKKQKAAAKAAAAAQMQPRSKAGLVAQRNNAAANAKAMVRTQAQVNRKANRQAALNQRRGLPSDGGTRGQATGQINVTITNQKALAHQQALAAARAKQRAVLNNTARQVRAANFVAPKGRGGIVVHQTAMNMSQRFVALSSPGRGRGGGGRGRGTRRGGGRGRF